MMPDCDAAAAHIIWYLVLQLALSIILTSSCFVTIWSSSKSSSSDSSLSPLCKYFFQSTLSFWRLSFICFCSNLSFLYFFCLLLQGWTRYEQSRTMSRRPTHKHANPFLLPAGEGTLSIRLVTRFEVPALVSLLELSYVLVAFALPALSLRLNQIFHILGNWEHTTFSALLVIYKYFRFQIQSLLFHWFVVFLTCCHHLVIRRVDLQGHCWPAVVLAVYRVGLSFKWFRWAGQSQCNLFSRLNQEVGEFFIEVTLFILYFATKSIK